MSFARCSQARRAGRFDIRFERTTPYAHENPLQRGRELRGFSVVIRWPSSNCGRLIKQDSQLSFTPLLFRTIFTRLLPALADLIRLAIIRPCERQGYGLVAQTKHHFLLADFDKRP